MERLLDEFIANDPEIENEIRKCFVDLSTVVRLRPHSVQWVKDVKAAGYHVYYLSNFSYRVLTEAAKEMIFLVEMEGGVMSYLERQIKPDEDIYHTLFNRYHLNPNECIFLDDSPKNLETAARLGMHTLQVLSQEQAMEDLKNILA